MKQLPLIDMTITWRPSYQHFLFGLRNYTDVLSHGRQHQPHATTPEVQAMPGRSLPSQSFALSSSRGPGQVSIGESLASSKILQARFSSSKAFKRLTSLAFIPPNFDFRRKLVCSLMACLRQISESMNPASWSRSIDAIS